MAITLANQDFIINNGAVILGTAVVTAPSGNTGSLQVNGGAAISQNLIVGSTATLYGSLSVVGATLLNNILTVTNTATVQDLVVNGTINLNGSVTNNGPTTFGGTATFLKNVIIDSTLTSISTIQNNALYIVGGVGIQSNLVVDGETIFNDSVTFNGTATYVYSTNTFYTENLIELHEPPGGPNSNWTLNDGKDIGLRFHYFNVTTTNAALVLHNNSKLLEWYISGADGNSGAFNSIVYGGAKFGSLQLVTGTPSLATTSSGDLTVVGGVGIGKDLTVGTTATIVGSLVVQGSFLGTINTATSALYAGTATNIAGGLSNSLPYQSTSSSTTFLPIGANGSVLTVSANTLTWATLSNATAGYALTSTNLLAGLAGSIPFQASPGLTAFDSNNFYYTNSGTTTATLNIQNISILGNTIGNAFGGALSVTGGAYFGQSVYVNTTTNGALTVVGGGTFGRYLTILDSTTATSSGTGALVLTQGGAYISANLYIGGSSNVNNSQIRTLSGNKIVYSDNSGNLLNSTATYNTTTFITSFAGLGATDTTVTNLNVTGQTTVGSIGFTNATGNNLTVTNTLTVLLQLLSNNVISTGTIIGNNVSVTGTFTATTLNVTDTLTVGQLITATNITTTGTFIAQNTATILGTTPSSNTLSGALIVVGGAGIGGDIWVGGTIYGLVSGTFTGIATTATNLAGGSAGQVPYQVNSGITAFTGTNAIGNVFVSNGSGSPQFQNTLTLSNSNFNNTSISGNTLQVTGGAGVGSLFVNDTATINGSLSIVGNLSVGGIVQFTGTITSVNSNSVDIGNKVIYLSTISTTALQTNGSGIIIGQDPNDSTGTNTWISLTFDGLSNWNSLGGINPTTNNFYNLGSTSYNWANVYGINLRGSHGYFGTLTATNITATSLTVTGQTTLSNVTASTSTITQLVVTNNINAGTITGQNLTTQYGITYADSTGTLQTTTATWDTALSQISGKITYAGTATNLAGGTVGSIPYNTNIGVTTQLPLGMEGQVLAVGTGTPYWASLSGVTVNTATNFSGGGPGAIPFQQASGLTVYDDIYFRYEYSGSTSSLLTVQNIIAKAGTSATSQITGALQVVGGAGITGSLYAGTIYSNGSQVLSSSGTGTGYISSITAGTDTAISTSTGAVTIWNTSTLQSVTSRGATTNNTINITNSTSATSTNSGALQVVGGVGVAGDIYGGNIYSNGNQVLTSGGGGGGYVSSVNAGTDISVNTTTGAITVSDTSTLQSVTGRGATTTNIVYITNTASSINTTSGALQVTGGVGIRQNLNIGGNFRSTGTIQHAGLLMTSGTNIDQIYTTSTTLTLNTNWQNTGVYDGDLPTGSYIVQCLANDSAQGGGEVNTYYTGVMSWYSAVDSDSSYDEITLHRAGAASGAGAIFLQVLRTNGGYMALQIAGDTTNTGSSTYTFSFRRMI